MPININLVKTLVYDLAAKQQLAYPSPQDFSNYANLAQNDLYNYYNDERAKLLLGVKAGETIMMPSTLTNFMQYQEVITVTTGKFSAPSGYVYDQSLTTSANVPFKKTDSERLPNYLNSAIDLPTLQQPVYVELANNQFAVYPIAGITSVKLTYLRYPNTVVWGYDLVNNRPVYSSAKSVDFEFPQTEILRLVSRILKYMGISMADEALEQAAQQMTVTAS